MNQRLIKQIESGEVLVLDTPYGPLVGTVESIAATMATMELYQSNEKPFPKGSEARLHLEDIAGRGFVWGHFRPMAAFVGMLTRFFNFELDPKFGELTLRKLKPASKEEVAAGITVQLNGIPHVYDKNELVGAPIVMARILGHDIFALHGQRIEIGDIELDIAYSPARKELSILLFVDKEQYEIGPVSTKGPMSKESVGSLMAFIGLVSGMPKQEIRNLLGGNYHIPKEIFELIRAPKGNGNGNGNGKVVQQPELSVETVS